MPSRLVLPILEYHCIAPKAEGARFSRAAIEPEDFARQVAWLADHGYCAVPLREVFAPPADADASPNESASSFPCTNGMLSGVARAAATSALSRRVVFTFDDGYLDTYRAARPILAERGWVGTVYAIPGLSAPEEARVPPCFGAPLMSYAELRELHASGWEIGGHTLTHPRLPDLPEAEQRREIADGKARLEDLLSAPVVSFAYPEGRYDAVTTRLVAEAGFASAVTTRKGNRHRPAERFTLRRVFLRPDTQGRTLAHRLGFWYDLHHRLRDWLEQARGPR